MDTAIEALFRSMLNESWFIASDGHIDSPTGYFGYVTNSDYEVNDIIAAFSETIDAYGMPDRNEIIGSYVAWIDSQGFIHIEKARHELSARHWFEARQREFSNWNEN